MDAGLISPYLFRSLSVKFLSLAHPSQSHQEALLPVVYTKPRNPSGALPLTTPSAAISSVQIYGRRIMWVLANDPLSPQDYDVEIWDWTLGIRLWVSASLF